MNSRKRHKKQCNIQPGSQKWMANLQSPVLYTGVSTTLQQSNLQISTILDQDWKEKTRRVQQSNFDLDFPNFASHKLTPTVSSRSNPHKAINQAILPNYFRPHKQPTETSNFSRSMQKPVRDYDSSTSKISSSCYFPSSHISSSLSRSSSPLSVKDLEAKVPTSKSSILEEKFPQRKLILHEDKCLKTKNSKFEELTLQQKKRVESNHTICDVTVKTQNKRHRIDKVKKENKAEDIKLNKTCEYFDNDINETCMLVLSDLYGETASDNAELLRDSSLARKKVVSFDLNNSNQSSFPKKSPSCGNSMKMQELTKPNEQQPLRLKTRSRSLNLSLQDRDPSKIKTSSIKKPNVTQVAPLTSNMQTKVDETNYLRELKELDSKSTFISYETSNPNFSKDLKASSGITSEIMENQLKGTETNYDTKMSKSDGRCSSTSSPDVPVPNPHVSNNLKINADYQNKTQFKTSLGPNSQKLGSSFENDQKVRSLPMTKVPKVTDAKLFQSVQSKRNPLRNDMMQMNIRCALQQNAQEADRFITQLRAFAQWRKNVRLIRNVRKQENEKWERAVLHHNKKIRNDHFEAWHDHIGKQESMATMLLRYHALSTGMKALKWMVAEARQRDAQIKQLRSKSTLSKGFAIWKERVKKRKHSRLNAAFTKWRSQLRMSLKLATFVKAKNLETLGKSMAVWKDRHNEVTVENIADEFYRIGLKRKLWDLWRVYLADCDVKKTRNMVAVERFRLQAIFTTFTKWRNFVTNLVKSKRLKKKRILKLHFNKWQQSTKMLKLRHQREIIRAKTIRNTNLLRRIFTTWCQNLQHRNHVKANQIEILRKCFCAWKSYRILMQTWMDIAEHKHRDNMLHARLNMWRCFVSIQQERRHRAVTHIKSCILFKYMHSWKNYVRGRRIDKEIKKVFSASCGKNILSHAFSKWKSRYCNRVLIKCRHLTWSHACVRKYATHWLKCARKSKQKSSLEIAMKKLETTSLRNYFTRWYHNHATEISNRVHATNARSQLECSKLHRIMMGWREATLDAVVVQPLVARRQRKLCARFFDAWFRFTKCRRNTQQGIELIYNNRMRRNLEMWKRGLEVRRMEVGVRRSGEERRIRRMLGSWSTIVARKRSSDSFTMKSRLKSKKMIFHEWMLRAQMVVTERDAEIEDQMRRSEVLRICFQRWQEEVECEKILRQDALTWFHRGTQIDTKLATFKHWKNQLNLLHKADEFINLKIRRQLKDIIEHWYFHTKSSLNESSSQFSSSLRIKAHTASCCSSATCSVVSMGLGEHKSAPEPGKHSRKNSGDVRRITSDSGLEFSRSSHSGLSTLSDLKLFNSTIHPVMPTQNSNTIMKHDEGKLAEEIYHNSMIPVQNSSPIINHCMEQGQNDSCNTENHVDHTMSLDEFFDSHELTSNEPLDEREILPNYGQRLEKAKFPFEVLTLESTQSRMEGIVNYAIHRLANPQMSSAFYQWKLFTHGAERLDVLMGLVGTRLRHRQLDYFFRTWSAIHAKQRKSRQHYEASILKPPFVAWRMKTLEKNKIKKLKRTSTRMNNGRILSSHFKQWRKRSKDKTALQEILSYWQSRVRPHGVDSEQENIANVTNQNSMLRRCVHIWSLRYRQVRSCDQHFSKSLKRRHLNTWVLHTREQKMMTTKIIRCQNQLVVAASFNTWKKRLELMEKVNEKRSLCIRSRLSELCKRWEGRAKEIRDLRRKSDIVSSHANLSVMTASFKIWQHKYSLRRVVDESHARAIMRKAFATWKYYTNDNSDRKQILNGFQSQQNHRMVTTCFQAWKKEHHLLSMVPNYHLIGAQIWWNKWKRQWNIARLHRLHSSTLLQHCFTLWRKTHTRWVAEKAKAKAVIEKWHSFTSRNRRLVLTAQGFISTRSRTKLHGCYVRWKAVWLSSLRAEQLYNGRLCGRHLTAWRDRTAKHKRELLVVGRLIQHCDRRQLRSAWDSWKEELLKRQHNVEKLATFESFRTRHVFTLWKRNYQLLVARKSHGRIIMNEVFTSWTSSLRNKQLAVEHHQCHMDGLLKETMQQWHHIASCNAIRRMKMESHIHHRNLLITSTSFNNWRNQHSNVVIATTHNANCSFNMAFMRWKVWIQNRKKAVQNKKKSNLYYTRHLLKYCMNIWRCRVEMLHNMDFMADEVVASKQHKIVSRSWGVWLDVYHQRKAEQHWRDKIRRKSLVGWLGVAHRGRRRKLISCVHGKVVEKQSFFRWKQQLDVKRFRKKHQLQLLHHTFENWWKKSSAGNIADTFYLTNVQRKVWTAWRLNYITIRTDTRFMKEQNFRLKMSAFQAWRNYHMKEVELQRNPDSS